MGTNKVTSRTNFSPSTRTHNQNHADANGPGSIGTFHLRAVRPENNDTARIQSIVYFSKAATFGRSQRQRLLVLQVHHENNLINVSRCADEPP